MLGMILEVRTKLSGGECSFVGEYLLACSRPWVQSSGQHRVSQQLGGRKLFFPSLLSCPLPMPLLSSSCYLKLTFYPALLSVYLSGDNRKTLMQCVW